MHSCVFWVVDVPTRSPLNLKARLQWLCLLLAPALILLGLTVSGVMSIALSFGWMLMLGCGFVLGAGRLLLLLFRPQKDLVPKTLIQKRKQGLVAQVTLFASVLVVSIALPAAGVVPLSYTASTILLALVSCITVPAALTIAWWLEDEVPFFRAKGTKRDLPWDRQYQ